MLGHREPGSVREPGPGALGAGGWRPGAAAGRARPGAAGGAGRGPRRRTPGRRSGRGPAGLPRGRPLVPGHGRVGGRRRRCRGGTWCNCVLLARVRHHRRVAAVLRRPGHPGRRPPQGRVRPRRTDRRRRAALPVRLLRAVALAGGLAAGALPGARPRRPADLAAARGRRQRAQGHGRPARRPAPDRPGVEGAGRAGAAAAARLRRRGQRAGRARRHRPPLRRGQRAPAAPGDAAGHRRRPGAACLQPADRCPGAGRLPHQRGPRRVPRRRAHPRADRGPRADLRRGRRGGPGGHPVHHPHPGSRRYRPVREGPRRAALRRRQRCPGHPGRAGARPGGRGLRRRRPQRLQHGGDGLPPRPAGQRRLRAARPRRPRDVLPAVAGFRRARGADRLHHQRRARADLGGTARSWGWPGRRSSRARPTWRPGTTWRGSRTPTSGRSAACCVPGWWPTRGAGSGSPGCSAAPARQSSAGSTRSSTRTCSPSASRAACRRTSASPSCCATRSG